MIYEIHKNIYYLYYIVMNKPQVFKGITADSERILYTPSPFARENLFYLQEAGRLDAKAAHISHRSYLDSFLFIVIESGSGTITVRNQEYVLSQGDCAFINCSEPYSHSTDEHPWSLRWVHFNGPTMAAVYQKYLERSGSIAYNASNHVSYSALLNQINESALSDSYVRDMELHQLLSSLLTEVMKDCWNPESIHKSPISESNTEQLRSYLSEHYTEKISLDELSSRFYLSKFYLTKLFKEQYGVTISDYILDLRIHHAKELLRFSNTSLEEIASECGFYDLPYFSRKFKKAEGITPSAYRNQWK